MNDNLSTAGQALILAHPFEGSVKRLPLKRAFDIVFSATVLILSLPLFVIVAASIFFSSRGKIVYAHHRIGRGGRPFRCYKFRTMYPDADIRIKEILEKYPEYRKEWEQNHKLKNDPRITPIGTFLRKTSLDEFPQFWNILKGDLSVVGPRPVVKAELEKHFGAKASKILSVRPGLTGLWQISGRSDTNYQTRILLDEQYVDNQSFLKDLKIISKTIPVMLKSKGAY